MPQALAAVNDFVVKFANVNGSGSASANELFARAILRMGVPVSPRNIFPSNIQGLPTWYEVRVTEKGYLGRRGGVDMMVAMNPQTWAEDVLFPHEQSMNDFDGIEEERRLMYVAITRARQRLYLSYAASRMLHGQTRYGVVSRFIDEIPPELCKWIVVPEKEAAYGAHFASGGYIGNSGMRSAGSGGSGNGASYTGHKQSYASQHYAAQNKSDGDYGRDGTPDTTRAYFETRRADAHPFAVGQNVSHTKFGEGVVVNFEGRGDDARVQVKFRAEGVKWLSLQYAKLTAL